MLTPTPEQTAIIEFAKHQKENLLINALAGSAKTTSLEMVSRALSGIPILSLAFNRRIADEMVKRLPSHVKAQTFNSLGHSIWAGVLGRRLIVNKDKMHNIVVDIIKSMSRRTQEKAWDELPDTLQWLRRAKRDGYIPPKWRSQARYSMDPALFFESYDDEPAPLQQELLDLTLTQSITDAYNAVIDYDDQIYMPCCFGGFFPKYPLILVDEFQDLNELQHEMLSKLVVTRMIGVGDKFQCHPPGTLITMTGGNKVPIESIRVGNEIVSYYTQKSIFRGLKTQGRRVEAINISDFSGNLLRLETSTGKTVDVTPNHKCLVRMYKDYRHALYLMQRDSPYGSQFRLGVTRLTYKTVAGVPLRARQEQADRVWILALFDTKAQARMAEDAYSGLFGLPQTIFKEAVYATIYGVTALNRVWEIIGNNHARGLEALKLFGKDFNCPIWDSKTYSQHYGTKSFIITACNIFEGMLICGMEKSPKEYNADKSGSWQAVTKITNIPYTGKVYGLTVEPTEGGRRLYIANDLVVHNSIYFFRGTKANGMDAARERWNMRELTLSTTFRVPQAGVRRAWFRVPHMRWTEGAHEGEVKILNEWSASDIPDGAAIVCRNNAPLFDCAIRLLRNKRGVRLIGFDIGPGLIRTMKNLGPLDLNGSALENAIVQWAAKEIARGRKESTVAERHECLRVLCESKPNLRAAITATEDLFKQKGLIQLMSIHKAKGLEWDHVFHLDPWRIPSRFAREGTEEWEQELNARYVAETRFKQSLSLVTLEGMV